MASRSTVTSRNIRLRHLCSYDTSAPSTSPTSTTLSHYTLSIIKVSLYSLVFFVFLCILKYNISYDTSCKGTFPYDSDLRPPPVSSDVYTHFTIISSFIYLLLFTSFPDISDLRRCRGTYSIPPHPHSILYHSHSPRFYNLLRPALESHSIYTLSRHLLRVSPLYSLGITLNKVSSLPSIIFSLHV